MKRNESGRAIASAGAMIIFLTFGTIWAWPKAHAQEVDAKLATAAPYLSANSASMRVAGIGYRLVTSNLSICPRRSGASGLILHDLSAYPARERPTVAATFRLGQGFGVLGVVPDSPAAMAGLKPGDEIVGSAALQFADWTPSAFKEGPSYDRIERFVERLDDSLSRGPVTLDVLSDGHSRSVSVDPKPACAAHFTSIPGTKMDAWSDDRYVAVTSGMVAQTNDDELAFTMGHELAHIILGHGSTSQALSAATGKLESRKSKETAADLLGLKLARQAGYDPAGAESLLRKLAESNDGAISFTHPAFKRRIEALRAEAAELSGPTMRVRKEP